MELASNASGQRAVTSIFVIQLDGEFDLAERDRIADAFAVAHSSPIVVVNLTKTLYIDSSVLGCLVELRKATQERGADLFLVGLRPGVLRIFEITGLDELFEIRSTLGDIPESHNSTIRRLTIESRPPP